MSEAILAVREGAIVEVPRSEWEGELRRVPEGMKTRLAFMSEQHHRVRRFVVAELPRRGRAIAPAEIAVAVDLPLERVVAIVAELEARLFFLVRDSGGAVAWAFPVTIEPTPHALAFSTGERCFAA